MLLAAKRPVLYAGQGVHWAEAWSELKQLAELLAIPVTTSLQGKSAFPETHPLSLGSGGLAIPAPVHHFLKESDLILGIGCSFTQTNFGVTMPAGKTIIHATLDPTDVNKDIACALAVLGDAKLTLVALIEEVSQARRSRRAIMRRSRRRSRRATTRGSQSGCRSSPTTRRRSRPIACCGTCRTPSTSRTPSSRTTRAPRATSSRRSGAAPTPLSYIGWGKTTQLGDGLGFAMGAKLAKPDKLCINVWGDAAIGFTGMDFETAVRERIPILSILLNNFSMAIELKVMPVSTEKYRSTDISGNYADFAKALGGYGERIEKPADIVPAIKRGIEATQEGKPALLEFITTKEVEVSKF